jgi:hypothetical protein
MARTDPQTLSPWPVVLAPARGTVRVNRRLGRSFKQACDCWGGLPCSAAMTKKPSCRRPEPDLDPLLPPSYVLSRGSMDMQRFLIGLGLVILVIGVMLRVVSGIGLGHLPGDITFQRD